MTLLAKPIFGLIARTPYGRDNLNSEKIHPWIKTWQSSPSQNAWWINQEQGIALFHPDLTVTNDGTNNESCLCIRGSVMIDGINDLQINKQPTSPTGALETILRSLSKYGTSAIRQMRGQFAFAFWDGQRHTLTLGRDHLGQRCLFTRTEADYIIFCSELAPLLHSPTEGNLLNEESVFWYLAFGMAAPGQTLVKNINRVPAAHVFNWQQNAPIVRQRYWSPLSIEAPTEVTEELIVQIRSTLENTTHKRLTDSGPQGIFLSGGVDSTFLASTAKRMGCSLDSFTAAFEEEYEINETPYAAAVCKWLNIPHHVVPIYGNDMVDLLDSFLLNAAEPCSAWAILTHFKILASAQQLGIKNMISGLGADEIFGGYDHFRGYYSRYLRYKLNHKLPKGSDSFEALFMTEDQSERRVLYPGVARFFDDKALREGLDSPYNRWQYASYLREFYRECRNIKPEADVMEMMIAHECQHRIPDLLFANFEPLTRRMGIEIGYPFLDPDIIALVCGLPVSSRYRTKKGEFSLKLKELIPRFKYTMMQVAADRVPNDICQRSRKSLTAPFGQWLYHPKFSSFILSRIQNSNFWHRNIVRRTYLDDILNRIVPGPNPAAFQLWNLFTLLGWFDRYIDQK